MAICVVSVILTMRQVYPAWSRGTGATWGDLQTRLMDARGSPARSCTHCNARVVILSRIME